MSFEEEFKALPKIKQFKLIRYAKKLKKRLCNSCKEKAKGEHFVDYCEDCYKRNKDIFDKMNKLTGEK